MQFHKVDTDVNFDVFKKVSEHGEWELGLTQMVFGCRVRLSRRGCGYCILDYCAGADKAFQAELMMTVEVILSKTLENVTDREIEDLFPDFRLNITKPINKDIDFWNMLKTRAIEKINEISI